MSIRITCTAFTVNDAPEMYTGGLSYFATLNKYNALVQEKLSDPSWIKKSFPGLFK